MDRSTFLKTFFTSIAGSTLLTSTTKADLLGKAYDKHRQLDSDNGEAYWEAIKKHFSLDETLYYFNNASLGPSPEIVIDATEAFRREMEALSLKIYVGWLARRERDSKKEGSGVVPRISRGDRTHPQYDGRHECIRQ